MSFDSQTVRSVGNAYFKATFAASTNDCFLFAAQAIPDIVSFSTTSTCTSSGHTCSFSGSQFKIKLNKAYISGTEIAISNFNYLDYAYTDIVQFPLTYQKGCTGTATTYNVFIETAFTISIPSSSVTIQSSSEVVGKTSQSLTVAVQDVTVPSSGKIIFTLPKQFGSTSMISGASCNSFTSSGLTTASCNSVTFGTSTDKIQILFTAVEGELTFSFKITNFNNPYTTSQWGDFELEIQQLSSSDNNYYGVSSGSGFKMQALTESFTIQGSISPEVGIIEEVDTVEIYFNVQGAKILEDCSFDLVLPTEISFESSKAKVWGKGCFAYSTGTKNTYYPISTSGQFSFSWPTNGGGGTIRGEKLCKLQSSDLECYLKVEGVVMPNYVMTTDSFQFFLYDSKKGLIGKQTTGLAIQDTQLVAGEIALNSFSSDNTVVQEEGVIFSFSFTPQHTVLSTTKITVEFPSDITLKENCVATSSQLDNDASTCSNNMITFMNPFNSNKGSEYTIQVEVNSGTNPKSVKEAGSIKINVLQQDSQGAYQLKNQYNGQIGYMPTQGSVFKATSQKSGGIQLSSYVTYDTDVDYKIIFETQHSVEAEGFILITLPSQIEVSGSGTTSSCLFNGENPQSCTLDGDVITLQLKPTQSITKGEENSVTLKKIQNPSTSQNTDYFVLATKDSEGNMIDQSSGQFTVSANEPIEFSKFQVTMENKVNLEQSKFTVSFSTAFPLVAGDILYLTFPSDLVLSEDAECEVVKGLKGINCSNTGNDLRVELNELSDKDGIGDFSFVVSNATNPGSTKETSKFSRIFLINKKGYNIARFSQTEGLYVQTKFAAKLLSANITQSSFVPNAVSTYKLKFTPNSPVPKDGLIVVQIPDGLKVKSVYGCRVKGPLESESLCSVSQISGRILIERAFNRFPNGYQGEVTIEKDFIVNLGDNSDKAPQSFQIQVFTDETQKYIMDEVKEGLLPQLECLFPCKSCPSSNKSQCLSCYTNSVFPFLQNGSCEMQCKHGFTSNGNPNKICEACDESCSGCRDTALLNDKFRCLKCSPNFNMTFKADNRCFETCTVGYFELTPQTCGQCQPPCTDCKGDQNYCTACDQNSLLKLNLDGQCLSSCPAGYGQIGNKCVACESPCATCSDSPATCTSCNGRNGEAWLFNKNCFQDCPFGTTKNVEDKICTGCLDGCKVCSEKNQAKCIFCQRPLLVLDGDCVASCPQGYVRSFDGKSCIEGILEFPIIYFPNMIVAVFLALTTFIGFFRHRDTLILTNLVIALGFAEKMAFLTQLLVSFNLKAEKYGAAALIGFILSIVLNYGWYWYIRKKLKDESFDSWKQDHRIQTFLYQKFSLIFSFKLTRLHVSKFAGLDSFRAGFKDPNVFWKPLIFFTIGQAFFVYIPFAVCDVVGLTTLQREAPSQLYYCMLETLILILIQSVLQIVELHFLRKQLGEIYKPINIDSNPSLSAAISKGQDDKLLKSIMEQNHNGPKSSSFMENENIQEEAKDCLLNEKKPYEEKTLKSNRGSAMKRTQLPFIKQKIQPQQEHEVEKSGLFMRVIETGDRTMMADEENKVEESTKVIQHSPENLPNFASKRFEVTTGSEFKRAVDAKKTALMFQPAQHEDPDEEAMEEEWQKQRLRKKRGRGRNNHKEILKSKEEEEFQATLRQPADNLESLPEAETQRVPEIVMQTDENLTEIKLTTQEEQKENSAQKKKREKEEKQKQKEQEKLKKQQEKEEEIRKKNEEKLKKELEKKKQKTSKIAQNKENELEQIRNFKQPASQGKILNNAYATAETANPNGSMNTAPQPLQQQFQNKFQDDESRGDRSITTIASKAMILPTEKTNSPPINSFLKIQETCLNHSSQNSNKKNASCLVLPRAQGFNENDILGDLDRDNKGILIVPELKIDKKGRKINSKGYLINQKGDVINKVTNEVVFEKSRLQKDGEIPTVFALERFNFNAQNIFEKGQICKDENGNVIDSVTCVIKINQIYLTKEGGLPKLLNFSGKRFELKDILGEFDKEENRDLIFQEDPNSGNLKDKAGNLVNMKGFLIDTQNNVINQYGEKIFSANELEGGEIPKIFPFTKFSPKKLLGEFDTDNFGIPILRQTPEGMLLDNLGRQVNQKGYLCDKDGNIQDQDGNIIFKNEILDKGDVPKVFRSGLLKHELSPFSKVIQNIDESELKKKERPRSSPVKQPQKRLRNGKREEGETSEEEGMGVTPSDFNFLNQQRIEPEITLEDGSIEEESLECKTIEREDKKAEKRKKEQRKSNQQKLYVDPVDAQISSVYGGPKPKPVARKPQLGHKFKEEESKDPKVERTKTLNAMREANKGPVILNGVLEQQKDLMLKRKGTQRQENKNTKKSFDNSQPTRGDQIAQNIDSFLEDPDWEMRSMESNAGQPNHHTRGSSRSNFDEAKFKGLQKTYLQKLNPKENQAETKERKYKSQVRNAPERDSSTLRQDTFGDEAPIKSTSNSQVHRRKMPKRDISAKNAENERIFPKVGSDMVMGPGKAWQ